MSGGPNIKVLDSLLMQKESGIFDAFRPPEIPRFLAPGPPTFAGMGRGKKKDLKELKKRELELWHQWDKGGRKVEDFQPLHQSFKPVINKKARDWASKNPQVPSSAIYHEMNKRFVLAMKSYNPNRGAALNTWADKNFLKAGRFIRTYQNVGKIPEGQIKLITPYKQAKNDLIDELGFEPDTRTIAERMGQPTNKIAQLEKEMRKDLAASGFVEDPVAVVQPKELEAFRLVEYDLTPEERTVYEHTFGVNGKPQLRPGEIAVKANLTPTKVSRIRNRLRSKIEEALGVLE
jgi:DNA-directed RNA polymerase specialized sigma subunit